VATVRKATHEGTTMYDLTKDQAALVVLTLLGTLAAAGRLSIGLGFIR
jgi:hypothetical protein